MRKVVIAGVGMTAFRREPGWGLRAMATEAGDGALKDSGIPASAVDMIYFGNAMGPTVTEQEMIKGQVAYRGHELARLPLINIENACASGSSAVHLGYQAIAGGSADVVLAIGAEQMSQFDRGRTLRALRGSTDVGELGGNGTDDDAIDAVLMELYAGEAQDLLDRTGATVDDLAAVAVKNRRHASMNPLAQFRSEQTMADVLGARMIADPLTLPMCSPITDGAAAVILCSEDYLRSRSVGLLIRIRACELTGGLTAGPVDEASAAAYRTAGIGPDDMHLIELHDSAASAELLQYGEIGLCAPGDEYQMIRSGATALGGRTPVNTSGGLLSRGHALGATGTAQIAELSVQLRGLAGDRQVADARLAMAVNCGGWIGEGNAVSVVTVLEAVR